MIAETIYYLICPKTEMLDLLDIYHIPLFRLPVLWRQYEGGSNSPNEKEWTTFIKMIFILYFRSGVLSLEVSNKQQILEDIMGQPPFAEAIFDKWWSIARATKTEELKTAMRYIESEQFDLLASTGKSRVDWLISKVKTTT